MKRFAPLLAVVLALVTVSCLGNLGRARPAGDPFRGRGPLVFPEDLQSGLETPEEAFQVAEYAPVGAARGQVPTVPWENLEGGVWVLFSQPVVPLGAAEADGPAGGPRMSIHPPLDGRLRWYGSRLLSFEPLASLAPATEYTVALDPELQSLSGQKLGGMNAFRFRTPALELLALEPSGEDVAPEQCRRLRLLFNYPVELDSVVRSLRLEAAGSVGGENGADGPAGTAGGAGGRRLRFKAGFDPDLADHELLSRRVLVLTPQRDLPWNSRVTVRLLAGARPAAADFPTAQERGLSFTTLEPLALVRGEVYDWLPTVEAGLVFNHPLAAEGAASSIQVELPGYAAADNLEVYGAAVTLKNLPVPFESSFRVRVRRGLRDVYGQTLPQDRELELEVGPAASYAYLHAVGDRILEAGFPPVVAVEFQNVQEGGYTAGRLADPFVPIPDRPLEAYPVESLPRNTRLFRLLDLSPFLNEEGKGSAFARWGFTVPDPLSEGSYPVRGDLRLQVTDLGLTAALAPNRVIVRLASLSTGVPTAGAEVALRGARGQRKDGRSDLAGVCLFPFEPGEIARFLDEADLRIEVSQGRDRLVFEPARAPSKNWNLRGLLEADQPRPAIYLVSDRGIYRPGETIKFFGIDRDVVHGRLLTRGGNYRVQLQRGWYGDNVIAESPGRLSPSGRFWGELSLPEAMEPDEYLLVYSRGEGEHRERVPVRIALFRRVGFSVEVELPEGEWIIGDRLEARFSGHYLGGGDLTRGRWSYWWSRRPIFFSPPDPGGAYRGFRFGDFPAYGGYDEEYGYFTEELSSLQGALGGDGVVPAIQELGDGRPGRVYEYQLTATVEDVDRQAVSRGAGLPVFTSSLLIGARLAAGANAEESLYFVEAGEPFTLQAGWLRPDGTAYGGQAGVGDAPPVLSVRLLREQWKMVRERSIGGRVDTRWVREEVEEGSFELGPPGRADARGRLLGSLRLRTQQVGAYIAEVRAADAEGREALTRVDFYSTGSANVLWRRGDETRIELVADRPSYAPGQRARLLIKSPLEQGTYLMTVEREGILEERLLELDGSTDTVEVEIREEYIPVLYVALSGYSGRTAPPPAGPDLPDLGKPRGVFGLTSLRVEAETRRIQLDIETSRASYRPGSEAELRIRATRNGRPLEGAEILVVAADRGVLDLIDYHLPDPLESFYLPHRFAHGASHYDSRDLLIDPVLWKLQDLPGGDKEGEELDGGPTAVRRDFRATAVFEPGLRTDAGGQVTVRFRLPDQPTRFRVTAVATGLEGHAGPSTRGELFGIAERELQVQNPINVRPALPRSLRIGDRATAGVVVTNLDDETREVTIRLESDLVPEGAESQQSLRVKAGESREMAFPLTARRPGTTRLRFHVDSAILREVLEVELPVTQGTIRETFTVIGRTESMAEEALVLPRNFLGTPEEGLAVTLDSTLASSLLEGIRFLDLYPYDCLEQRTSKLFAYLLFGWLLEDSKAIAPELELLGGYQTEEGGMSFWADPGFRRPSYYVSLRTAHLLRLAEGAGYSAGGRLDTRALLGYLEEGYPAEDRYLQAYALYVLSLYGRGVGERRAALIERPSLSLAERALVALSYLAEGNRPAAEGILVALRNYFRVGTRSVTLVEPQRSWGYFGGNLQAKSLLLMLYSRLEPDSQIGQALADDLLASARRGYWVNTSDTGWVLQGFAEAMEAGGDRSVEFTARVSLGDRALVLARFSGPSRVPFRTRIEPARLEELAGSAVATAGGPALPLVVSKEGSGRLYYTLSLSRSLAGATVGPRDEGIGLFTEILDRQGRPVAATLELGEVYRLHGVVYSSRDRDFMALRLPLPAGAEALDGSLATTQSLPPRDSESEEHQPGVVGPIQRIYDDEVRLFYDSFRRGKREFSFLFRATTPGVFVVPPATAELMYEEEVFGRTGGQEIRIGPRR